MTDKHIETIKEAVTKGLTTLFNGDSEAAQIVVNKIEKAVTKHPLGQVTLNILDKLSQTATELHEKVVPEKESNAALSTLFKASEGAVDVMNDFRAFHDELKAVSDTLKAAGCETYLTIEYPEGQMENDCSSFTVDCNNAEKLTFSPHGLHAVDVEIPQASGSTCDTWTNGRAVAMVMDYITNDLSFSDQVKIDAYHRSMKTQSNTVDQVPSPK